MKFYNCDICPFAQRVAITFHETIGKDSAGVIAGVEQIEIDLQKKPDWYPTINPLGKVPALKTDEGRILVESAIITEYIIEKYGKRSFFGESLEDKAELKVFAGLFDSYVGLFYALLQSKKESRKVQSEKLDAVIKKVILKKIPNLIQS